MQHFIFEACNFVQGFLPSEKTTAYQMMERITHLQHRPTMKTVGSNLGKEA